MSYQAQVDNIARKRVREYSRAFPVQMEPIYEHGLVIAQRHVRIVQEMNTVLFGNNPEIPPDILTKILGHFRATIHRGHDKDQFYPIGRHFRQEGTEQRLFARLDPECQIRIRKPGDGTVNTMLVIIVIASVGLPGLMEHVPDRKAMITVPWYGHTHRFGGIYLEEIQQEIWIPHPRKKLLVIVLGY